MTLLIASIEANAAWMVADTAITDGKIPLRERRFRIKNIPSTDRRALVGFAGDQHHGTRLIQEAARLPAGRRALELLLEGHRQYPSTVFAYAFVDASGPRLFKVADARADEVQSLHLGVADAFDHFQRIRHNPAIDPVPEAVQIFVAASVADEAVPEGLSTAIITMLRLFAARAERDVGGWPVPCHLLAEGAFLCSYAYSVSDPVLSKSASGALVHHGTAEAGGFALSLTPLGIEGGMVVYWLQRPGGYAYVMTEGGYTTYYREGRPSAFKERMQQLVGRPIDVWFGDNPTKPVECILAIRDEDGQPAMAVAKHGGDLSFAVINTASTFKARAAMDRLRLGQQIGGAHVSDTLSLALVQDKSAVTLELRRDGQPASASTMDATELDLVLTWLGGARAQMPTTVAAEPSREPGTRELVAIDPAWRTERAVHAALKGITLRLRHPGFGWLTFVLPFHEAASLAKWLGANSPT